MVGVSSLVREALSRVDGLRAFELASLLSRLHRVQGSQEVTVAAEHLAQLLEEAGVDARLEVLHGPLGLYEHWGFWEPRGWRLYSARLERRRSDGSWEVVASTADTPLVAVAHSPPGTVEGEARLVGSPESHRDERVPVVSSLAWEAYYRLVEAGAEAVVAFHEGPGVRYWGIYPPFFMEPPKAPGVSVELEKALQLNREKVRVTVEAELHAMPETPVLVARLGPEEPLQVLLTAHICHPSPGAHDNASGVAVLAEALIALKEVEPLLREAGVSIAAVAAPEWTGLAAAFAQGLLEPRGVLAAVSLDMVGASPEATGGLPRLVSSMPPLASPIEPFLDAALREALPGYTGLKGYEWGSDHDVAIGSGVPSSLVNEWPDRFYHTSLDTPDHLSPQLLARAAAAVAAAVVALARGGLERGVAAAMEAAGLQVYGLQASLAPRASVEAARELAGHSRRFLDALRRGIRRGAVEPPWSLDLEVRVRPPFTRSYLYLRGGDAGRRLLGLEGVEKEAAKAMLIAAASTGSMEVARLHYVLRSGKEPPGWVEEAVRSLVERRAG